MALIGSSIIYMLLLRRGYWDVEGAYQRMKTGILKTGLGNLVLKINRAARITLLKIH